MSTRFTSKLKEIHAELRQKITAGEFKEGDLLPTTGELAKLFDSSVGMASKAIAMLIHEGLVEQRRGLGTRVIKKLEPVAATSMQLDAFAFIYPGEKHEGIWRTVKGFQDGAHEAGRRSVMLTTGSDYRKEAEFMGRLSEFDVKGAVVFPVLPNPEDIVHFSKMLVASRFPVVLVEINLPGLGCPSVIVDGFHAGYTMTRHLLGRGARRIGYFSNYSWAPFMRDRYQGYRWALQEANIEEPTHAVMLDPAMHPDFNQPVAEPTRLARNYFKMAGKIEAVVCADDYLALGCIAAAKEIGIEVPRDLLVTGMDDYAISSTGQNSCLTTYRIPYEQLGRKSFEVLDALRIKSSTVHSENQIRGSLIVRETA